MPQSRALTPSSKSLPPRRMGAGSGSESDTGRNFGVSLENVSKVYGDNKPAVDRLSFTVEPGAFVSMLGPSGCGKTTTLRMIAGLENPTDGTVGVNGKTVFSAAARVNVAPHRRNLGFVFQSYALWPHMSVYDNIAYPLKRSKAGKSEVQRQVARTLVSLQCEELSERYPSELSGGQQQRVALGRAIVSSSNSVVLFDEPLSNLDARLRESLRLELRGLQRELGFTAIYVTHDRDEAMSMSDSIIVMHAGHIERSGTPMDVVDDPQSERAARLIGYYNFIEGTRTNGNNQVAMTALGQVSVGGVLEREFRGRDKLNLALPYAAVSVSHDRPAGAHFEATVLAAAVQGMSWDLHLRVNNHEEIRCSVPRVDGALAPGMAVYGRITAPATVVLRQTDKAI